MKKANSDKLALLKSLEKILIKNKSAVEESIRVLTRIKTENLFSEDGFTSWTQYAKANAARFGIKWGHLCALVYHEQIKDELPKLTGVSFESKNASRVVMPVFDKLPKERREEAMKDFGGFVKSTGSSVATEKHGKQWIRVEAADKYDAKNAGNNYGTPGWLFDVLAEIFQCEVDVCANNNNAKCKKFFDGAKVDGLQQDWTGWRGKKVKAIWCNPPFDHIGEWIHKAYETALSGTDAVVLTTNSTDAKWFHWHYWCADILFIEDRVAFGDEPKDKNNAYGTMVGMFHQRELTDAQRASLRDLGFYCPAQVPLDKAIAWARVYPDFEERIRRDKSWSETVRYLRGKKLGAKSKAERRLTAGAALGSPRIRRVALRGDT